MFQNLASSYLPDLLDASLPPFCKKRKIREDSHGWCNLHNASCCMMQVAGYCLWPREARGYLLDDTKPFWFQGMHYVLKLVNCSCQLPCEEICKLAKVSDLTSIKIPRQNFTLHIKNWCSLI